MDFARPEIAIQASPTSLQKTGNALKKIFVTDPGLLLQLFLTLPVLVAGVMLHLSFLQWFLVALVSLLFLAAGVFRTAALLQIHHDSSMHPFHVSRIKWMGNALVTVTAGLSLVTYLLVFVPVINQMI
jgi:diacylglycerol kinase